MNRIQKALDELQSYIETFEEYAERLKEGPDEFETRYIGVEIQNMCANLMRDMAHILDPRTAPKGMTEEEIKEVYGG